MALRLHSVSPDHLKITTESGVITVIRGTTGWLAALLVAGLTLPALQANANNEYYRWKDGQGNPVHSDRPPPQGTPYEVISTESKNVRKVARDEDRGASNKSKLEDEARTAANEHREQPSVDKNPTYCEQAKQNLQTLETAPRIRILGNDGEYRFLSDDERDQQKKTAQANISVYCE
jgi:Domain of unknown function (DUF4124)